METVQKIKFQGKDYILTTPKNSDSTITTIEAYKAGECSFAHLYRSNGNISRFGKSIGTIEDIEFGELIDIELDLATFADGLFGNTWPL